jgi:DNA-binding CsgD family transcriptional regulator
VDVRTESDDAYPTSDGLFAHDREGWAFVGRERELAALREAREGGVARGVVIVGAAGVGKTRLLRAALDEARGDGAEVQWVRATASAATIPLAAVVSLLEPTTAADPLRMFQASAEALLGRAGGRPLVIGVDDAHLLDSGSAALLLHLAEAGAFIVATVRSGERPPDAVTALWKDERARRVELASLDEGGTMRLVEVLLAAPVEHVLTHWAHAASAGNPLYLRELLAGAVEAGAVELDNGLWRLRWTWPPGPALAELVAQRLEGLGAASVRLLAALSLGEPLPAAIAGGISGDDALIQLETRGLTSAEDVEGERVLRLAHPLYGEVARMQLAGSHLDELRVALADALQERGLCPGEAMRVAKWLRDAGAPIGPQLLLEAAAEAYRARDPALAAELAAPAARDGHGFEALLALGEALAALGRHEDAERAFTEIADVPPSPQLATKYLFARINVLAWGLGRPDEAERLVLDAVGWWADDAWRQQATALRMMVLASSGGVAQAAQLADELAADAQLHPAAAGLLATSGAMAWLHAGRTAQARAASEQALPPPPADERPGDRELAGLVSWALTRVESGSEWDVVQGRIERIERAAARRGDRITAGPADAVLGRLALQRGAPGSAIGILREAVGHLEHNDPRGLAVVITAQIAIAAGLLADAKQARAAEAESRARLGGRMPAWHEAPALARASAWAAAAAGEYTRPAAELIELAARPDAWPLWQVQVLRDALSLGAPAARVVDGLRDAAERCDAPLATAAARHGAALAAEDAPLLGEVAVQLETVGAQLMAAEAAAQAAAIFRAEGRPTAARRAAALSARTLARCEGASTPALRAAAAAPADLTPREQEIASLAASGRSNAEIADLLTVSVRTVESHLYHAMSKLGTGHREELTTALESRPSILGFDGFQAPD